MYSGNLVSSIKEFSKIVKSHNYPIIKIISNNKLLEEL
jgi:hypothetical protein